MIGIEPTELGRSVLAGALIIFLAGIVLWAYVTADGIGRGAKGVTTKRKQYDLGPNWQTDNLCQSYPLLPQCIENQKIE